MISMALWRRPNHDWPIVLVVADVGQGEPARRWDDRPDVLGLEDGSLALNGSGVMAAMLSAGSPGPRPVSELVLDALDFADAKDAAEALRDLDPAAYQPFTLLVADNRDAYVIRRWNESRVEVESIAPGRLDFGQPMNLSAPPEPGTAEWAAWLAALPADCTVIALPSIVLFGTPPLWHGTPCLTKFPRSL